MLGCLEWGCGMDSRKDVLGVQGGEGGLSMGVGRDDGRRARWDDGGEGSGGLWGIEKAGVAA